MSSAPAVHVGPDAPGPRTLRRPERAAPAPGRAWLIALMVGLAVGVAAYLVMPVGTNPPVRYVGPIAMAGPVEDSMKGVEHQIQAMTVARSQGGRTEYVAAGVLGGPSGVARPGPETTFETGSIFKTFTAMTLADMVEKGEVELDTTLGEVFTGAEFADPEVAEVTLEDLATHHSGMPAVPTGSEGALMSGATLGTDPFRGMPALEDGLAVTRLGEQGRFLYSNFGFAVLGKALAEVSGTAYPELVRERVLDPVGLDHTFIHGADRDELPEDTALPHREAGQRVQIWRAPEWAPAGVGTFTTTDDLIRFGEAVRKGTAPGMGAVEPRTDAGGEKGEIGLGWLIAELDEGTTVRLHDGRTSGSSAILLLDEDKVVAGLSNTSQANPFGPAMAVYGAEKVPVATDSPFVVSAGTAAASTLPLVVLPPLFALALMLRRRTLIGQRHLDRLRVISMPLGAFALVLSGLSGYGWPLFTPVSWAAAMGAIAAAATVGGYLAPRLPVVRARRRWLRITFFVISVTSSVLLIAFMAWWLAVVHS